MKPNLTAHSVSWLLCVVALSSGAKVEPAMERQVGGVYSNACGNAAHPMVRLYGDVMSIEIGPKKVAATKFRTLKISPVSPPSADFKVAFEGDVPGGDGLVFVLTHNKDGLFVTPVGGAKSLATLPGVQGKPIRHCDPNRNALPGAPPPATLPSPPQLLKDARFRTPYFAALGPMAREPWLRELTGPAPETQKVTVAGTSYLMASVCKPHDCYDHNLVLLYDAARGVVYGKLNQAGRSMLFGRPPAPMAAELERLWRGQFRK
jgi:Inhibitor of vertebrate lysozyme (Ivy)